MKKGDPNFKPDLTPKKMLELGVFGGDYFLKGQKRGIPKSWFVKAKLSDHGKDPKFNFFKVSASQPLSVWKKKGWVSKSDPCGWFQWYCRYYIGRRIPKEDQR